jgi:DNA mismatch repair protein MutS
MGDFYEMFHDDAELAARELGLALTTRDRGKPDPVPMAGVPHHAAEGYIARLVRKGYRVAVCDQVGDPARSKGLVDRRVVEIVTPGTAVSEALVPETANNFVAAVLADGDVIGLAAADVGTGEFLLEELPADAFPQVVSQLPVSEWILPAVETEPRELPGTVTARAVRRPPAWFDAGRGDRELRAHFGVHSLRGLDWDGLAVALGAGAGLLAYLREVRGPELRHLVRARRLGFRDHMVLDETTRRNLELTAPIAGDGGGMTLWRTVNRTVTSPGARRLRSWMDRPLLDPVAIEARLDAVGELVDRPDEAAALRDTLRRFRDQERLLAKTSSGKATPRDVRALGESAEATPELARRLAPLAAAAWKRVAAGVADLSGLGKRIVDAVVESPPATVGEGRIFRHGFDPELDTLRDRAHGGKRWISALQESERKATGISSLKVGYNKVFGYYLEVTAAHQAKVPEHYIRKQTLVNAERYVTPELKTEEEKILRAEDALRAREADLFRKLCGEILDAAGAIQDTAAAVGEADATAALAEVARDGNYRRPRLTTEPVLQFTEARHPVVETLLPVGEFVPNDLVLDLEGRRIAIITGPNMAGKSTFLRQAALLVVLAQMGSFVPAASARIGIVDRIFTRVGAADNITRGQSTFMVEMEETAIILNAATARSLVILDEVGRGTSTYDGLSIAWAVTEHLHQRPGGAPRTLFATHYHELTDLADILPRVVNLNVQVKEWNGKVVFLRKIVEGTADKSYGIHVAELAGLPPEVVARAHAVLARLESEHRAAVGHPGGGAQLTLFEPVGGDLLGELRTVNPEALTPLEALTLVTGWKTRFGSEE